MVYPWSELPYSQTLRHVRPSHPRRANISLAPWRNREFTQLQCVNNVSRVPRVIPRHRAVSTHCTGYPTHWTDLSLRTPLVALATNTIAILHEQLDSCLLSEQPVLESRTQYGSRTYFCSVVVPLNVLSITT